MSIIGNKVLKLVVEVIDAHELMPRDGQGSSSPFVEVDYDNQRQRTHTVEKNLNPVWKEKLVFDVNDPAKLPHQYIAVYVYSENKLQNRRNSLGRVRIHGSSVVGKGDEAFQYFPLETRRLFSSVKGEIRLKIYTCLGDKKADAVNSALSLNAVNSTAVVAETSANLTSSAAAVVEETVKDVEEVKDIKELSKDKEEKLQTEEEKKEVTEEGKLKIEEEKKEVQEEEKKQKPVLEVKSEPIVHLHKQSVAFSEKGVIEEKASEAKPVVYHNFSRTGMPHMDYSVRETAPSLGTERMKMAGTSTASGKSYWMGMGMITERPSTYDLVEEMEYLYVRVVRARALHGSDMGGSCNPYVEVRLGNYKGTTKHFENTNNPEWNMVFAFSKDRIQSTILDVVVKDKEFVKDDSIGRVMFDLHEVTRRVPPDSPLAPQWYRLEDRRADNKNRGEIMLAVWLGTQADEAFPEAWHSEAASLPSDALTNIKSKVYVSPKLWYVRVNVIEAQDLLPGDRARAPDATVRVQIGNQILRTKPAPTRATNPLWNEDLVFVAAEPFEEHLVLVVEDRVAPGKDEMLGKAIIPLSAIDKRLDYRPVNSRWFNLERYSVIEGDQKKKETRFASRIHLRVCLEGGYHVLDESTLYSSDLRPTAKQLWKPPIGLLEVGILGASNLMPMRTKDERGTTDAYCVAKYGHKWIRTRTIIDSFNPKWNEQYSWDVYDPCTVITIGVFDNCHLHQGGGGAGGGGGAQGSSKDSRIGKIRIRLSTLETERVYTHSYPLLLLLPSGVKKMGELHLAIRFCCTSYVNMMHAYTLPLLPKMHYLHPFSVGQVETLRYQAMNIVSMRLGRAEPPLRKEVVEYLLDVDSHMWSMRRSKANFFRIMSVLSGLIAVGKWFDEICHWRNPTTTVLVHFLFLILVCYPELILPTIFLYMFLIGLWYFRFRPRFPPHMDTRLSHAETINPDELDEEFDTFPTSKPPEVVRRRYDRLRSVAGRIQTVVGDIATQGERFQSLLSWRDPRATSIFVVFCLVAAIVLYATPFRVIIILAGLYVLRHPRFRYRLPSVPVNFFRRLPARTDSLL